MVTGAWQEKPKDRHIAQGVFINTTESLLQIFAESLSFSSSSDLHTSLKRLYALNPRYSGERGRPENGRTDHKLFPPTENKSSAPAYSLYVIIGIH